MFLFPSSHCDTMPIKDGNYFSSQFQATVHYSRRVTAEALLVTSHPRTRAERNDYMQIHALAGVNSILQSYTV